MRENSVKRSLKEGKLQLGCGFGNFRSAEIPKILAAAGLQWAFVDTEHGNFDLETVNDICRVARSSEFVPYCARSKRLPVMRWWLGPLDCGAGGIIFPAYGKSNSWKPRSAGRSIRHGGVRGYGLAPNNADYEPLTFTQMIDHYNANLMRVVQIRERARGGGASTRS